MRPIGVAKNATNHISGSPVMELGVEKDDQNISQLLL